MRGRYTSAVVSVCLLLSGCRVLAHPTARPSAQDVAAQDVAAQDVAAQVDAARALVAALPVGGRGPKTGYDRAADFGAAWADVDGNGCDTRDDILRRDLDPARTSGRCTVVGGILHDPYTGRDVTLVRDIQIDHVVPLALAWQLGAAQWDQAERVSFANDPANLLAVEGAANQQKSASGPDSWLPPNKPYRCTYVMRFARVVSLYALQITSSIRDAIIQQLGKCAQVDGNPLALRRLVGAALPA